MVVGGLLKLSFSDYPGKPAAVVFTRGCFFRCPWCHNPGLVDPARYVPEVPLEEVLRFLKNRQQHLDAVVVSGGEPTLQPDLPGFLRALKGMGYAVKLDTNGSHPGVLRRLLEESLVDCLAVDYKVPSRLYRLVRGDPAPVLESVALALSDPRGYIRTTIVPGVHPEPVLEEMKSEVRELGFQAVPGEAKWRLQEFRQVEGILDPGKLKEVANCGQQLID